MRRSLEWAFAFALVALSTCASALGQTPKISAVVNSANYSPSLALGSLVTIFGENLGVATQQSTTATLPTVLAGSQASVCLPGFVNCFPLQIWYASPTQINAVMPRGTSTASGAGSATFQIFSGLIASDKFTARVAYTGPGIFQQGFDCAYPASCPISQTKSVANSVNRGAITDLSGRLVGSQNPILAGQTYVIYLTGLGFPQQNPGISWRPTVYLNFGAINADYGVTTGPDFAGPSPCCSGLDQINFQLPLDLRRAFTDGENLPACGSITASIATEMRLTVDANILGQTPPDVIQVPVLLRPGDLKCR